MKPLDDLPGTMPELRALRGDLQSRLDGLHSQAKAVVGRAEASGRELTRDEQTRVAGLHAEFATVEENLNRVAAQIDAEAEFGVPVPRVCEPMSARGSWPTSDGTLSNARVAPLTTRGAPNANGLFGASSDRHGFPTFGEFMRAVADPRDTRVRNSMSEGTSATGGAAVPPGYSQELWQATLDQSDLLKLLRIVPMSTPSLTLPAWDDLTRSSTLGGLAGQWLGEAASATDQTGALREVALHAKKVAVFLKASGELQADVPNFDREISRQMINALNWTLTYAVVNGTGVGQPLGFLNAPSVVTATKENAQSGTLTAANLYAMASRLAPQCWKNSVWLVSPSALVWIFSLSQAAAPKGAAAVALADSTGAISILGRPVLVSEHCQALATRGDVYLVDPTQYLLGVRKEIAIEVSTGPGWQTDQLSYRAITRADGLPTWDKAMTPRVGGTTLSWCVALETR